MEREILKLMCSIIRPLQNCLTTSKIHHTAELWTVKTHVVETSIGFQKFKQEREVLAVVVYAQVSLQKW